MHSAVMQNKKYIKFANKHTVEVISLQDLQKGIDAKDRKAATYKVKGSDTEFLIEFPGLTVEDMLGLHKSQASRYNNTGKIPYTAVVDPHTQKEVGHGYRSSRAIMEAVDEGQRRLAKRNAISLSGKDDARDESRASRMNAG